MLNSRNRYFYFMRVRITSLTQATGVRYYFLLLRKFIILVAFFADALTDLPG